jgi:hypothetical protein
LSTNSRELSMSSAKTVADILAFTELIDVKTGIGNPFTRYDQVTSLLMVPHTNQALVNQYT